MMKSVHVIGGGLAGSELALQLANRGIKVYLHEMRPLESTGVHKTDKFAELVCSNSLKSEDPMNAEGLLKAELRILNSILLDVAEKCRVPAGKALAVDRECFSQRVSQMIDSHPNVEVIREVVTRPPEEKESICVLATGPATHEKLMEYLEGKYGKLLHFFDAVSPIVYAETIDFSKVFVGDRYGKGSGDYINCPMDEEDYRRFWESLVNAEVVPMKDFDRKCLFQRCQPIEEIARSGYDALRFGPLRPVGLRDPETGRTYYAVVQLRRENLEGSLYSLVGFQTRLTWKEQKRVLRLIPGLEKVQIARYGVMHRNSYIEANKILDIYLRCRDEPSTFIVGQLAGFEGYVSAIATGLHAAINIHRMYLGLSPVTLPSTSMLGALVKAVIEYRGELKPLYPNFGILPFEGKSRLKNRGVIVKRALSSMEKFVKGEGAPWLVFKSA